MTLKEHIYSVLIVSASAKFNTSITSMLSEREYSPVHIVSSISQAQRYTADQNYDLILINAPLPDDFGRKFAIDMSIKNNSVVLLLVKNELYEEIYGIVMEYGVFAIGKPTSVSGMKQALDYMRAAKSRLKKLEKKTVSLEDKMSEIRLVNRAKWALIDSCKMTESDAHRYIEKQAMDRCMTRREIAENILNTYST